MALLDFLKNKEDAAKAKKNTVKKAEKASVAQKTPEPKSVSAPAATAKTVQFSYSIVKGPHISEKATIIAEKNQYTFKVEKNANKLEVKKAIEGIYGVDVLRVNMIKIPPKKRRLGKTQGFKKGFVKAVVSIKPGQKIEII